MKGKEISDGLGDRSSAEGMPSSILDFAVNTSCCCAVEVHLLYTSDSLDHEKAAKTPSCKTLKRCTFRQAHVAGPLVSGFVVLMITQLQLLLRDLMREQGWHLLPWDLLSEEWTKIGLRIDVIQPMAIRGVSYHKLEPIAARRYCARLSRAFQHGCGWHRLSIFLQHGLRIFQSDILLQGRTWTRTIQTKLFWGRQGYCRLVYLAFITKAVPAGVFSALANILGAEVGPIIDFVTERRGGL